MENYKPEKVDYSKDVSKIWDRNHAQLNRIDKEAKDAGKLEGRYISEPYADGYAFYQITKAGLRKVKIVLCTGLGDDWAIPYWGAGTSIDREYAEVLLKNKDLMNSFAEKHGTMELAGA